jgi:SNF2 family DNA or RNA helicase
MIAGGKHGALAAELGRLSALAAGVTDTKKTDALLSILRAHAEPALVFTRFRETLEHVVAALERAKMLVHVLRGGMSAEERTSAIEAFRARGGVLVATGVGSEGTNLQFARLLVNFDLPWNPMVIEQRIGRLHRMGQEREVLVFNLCARGTAEERVLGVLSDRLHLFELVVGEMDMVLGNVADERDLEERILDLYASASGEADIERGFEALAEELAAARTRYDRAKAFDEALFGEDYET